MDQALGERVGHIDPAWKILARAYLNAFRRALRARRPSPQPDDSASRAANFSRAREGSCGDAAVLQALLASVRMLPARSSNAYVFFR
jgi:hypothetical protein